MRTFDIWYVIIYFRTSSLLSKEKILFFGASTVIQNDYLMVEYIYYTTSLVSDDVAIQCNRPIKSRHQAKYETIYHTFSSCRRPSQPIGWFQIRHTHFIFDTHIFPFTWCADFTYYFYIFDRENRSYQEKLRICKGQCPILCPNIFMTEI